jgi:hypothetical protein
MIEIKFSSIPEQSRNAVLRFPVATLCCFAFYIIAIFHINEDYDSFAKLLQLLPLGYVLSISLRLFTEDAGWRGWRSYADVTVIPLLVLYYILLPDVNDFSERTFICYGVFFLVAIIGLVIAPYRSLAQPERFWIYNVKIVWSMLLSVICTGILFGGLSLTLISVEFLFDVTVPYGYFHLSVFWCVFVAHLVFAAGIPAQSQRMEQSKANYSILSMIGQYILLPLLLLYLIILYIYGLKILIIQQLPEGEIAIMTIAYSVAGLFVYLLLHHSFITKTSKAAIYFCRYFFYSELPIIVLLFVAVIRRTVDYGITESRYFLWLGVFWLLGISLYMIFTGGKSFRPVFVSFAVVMLLSVTGPWSMFNVSDYSQKNRLEALMIKNNVLNEGKYVYDPSVSKNNYDEMENIVMYFVTKRNVRYLQPLFTDNIDSICSKHNIYKEITSTLIYNQSNMETK